MFRISNIIYALITPILYFACVPAIAADYVPAWNTQCAQGSDLDKGCAEVRARKIVDSRELPWRAVGRVNVAGLKNRGHCTGTLVGKQLVATAAHCLFVRLRKRWALPSEIHFVAGAYPGGFAAHAQAAQYHVSPVYDIGSHAFSYNPHDDWAIIELKEPIGADIGYLPWGTPTQAQLAAARVGVAGYPAVRPHALSIDFNCGNPAFQDQGRLLVQHCATMKGDSGAPILLRTGNTATLIAVHSGALADQNGNITPVSTAVSVFADVLKRLSARPAPEDRTK